MKKLISFLFIAVIFINSAALFILPDADVSELENRSLTKRNDISLNFLDGEFQNTVENFVSDQFPLRDKLIYLHTGMLYASGQREIDGAYVCDDGRLVQYVTDSDINRATLTSYAKKVNKIAEKNTVYVMYVPSACVELKEKMPGSAPTYSYNELYEELISSLSNAKPIDLSEALSDEGCFYRTDHHWNYSGAYKAYCAFCEAKGVSAKPLESFILKTVSTDFRGTLFSKVPFSKQTDEIIIPDISVSEVKADGVETPFYNYGALEKKDKYNVFQGGNHGIVEIENKDGNGNTLLVLKDSFANSFVPFIAEEYSKIVMLDERYTFVSLESFVDTLSPDEILVLREIIN